MSSRARTLELSASQRLLLDSIVEGAMTEPSVVARTLAESPIRLSAEVLSTKRVPADSGVSYGHTYRTKVETTLALVSIGYGYGIPRKAGNRADVTWWDPQRLRAVRLPIVGRVAMDVLVVDAGDTGVVAAERCVLFGDPRVGEISLVEWSKTIAEDPVSLVCALDSRVLRAERP